MLAVLSVMLEAFPRRSISLSYHDIRLISSTSLLYQRFGGSDIGRNPKIKISLEQLRMAARGMKRRLPICHEEHEKVMNSLQAAKYENPLIYKYIMEYDNCRDEYDRLHKGKDKRTMMLLNKYVVKPRRK